jgi:hypothetical protein
MEALMIRTVLAAVAAMAGLPAVAHAEVVDQGPGGFTIRHQVGIEAPAGEAFATLLELSAWWDPDHTYTGDASALSLNPVVGGCWCETFPEGGGVEHMRVVYLAPAQSVIRFQGGLGPLQGMGATGAMTITVRASEDRDGSVATLTYVVMGYSAAGLDQMAGPVDFVLGQAMERYAAAASGEMP